MAIFSSKISYLGVDIGSSSIKLVELANFGGRPRLVTYGFTEKNPSNIGGSLIADTNEITVALNEICRQAKTGSRKAIAALPSFSVFTSILNLPSLSRKELASTISWEAKKIIPIPLEEIILDWKIIEESSTTAPVANEKKDQIPGDHQNGGLAEKTDAIKRIFSKPKKNLKILLTGANKNLVKKYVDVFNGAGLNLLSLETESFALIRSLVGNDRSVAVIVDLGAVTSTVIVVDRGIPALSRTIEVGGLMLTKTISTSLDVNLDRAEQFKQDMSLNAETADNSLPQTVERAFSPILNEIKYTISLYQEQNNKKVEKIILTGGSALLGHLPGYLSKVLNINTYLGDPWSRVVYPTELRPILDRLGSRFAVAIGLAMRDIE